MQPAFTYADHEGPAALARHVVNYWTLDVPATTPGEAVYFVPPDGCTHLAFHGPVWILIGPHVRPLRPPLVPGARWFGIRFRPGAARLFLRSTRLPLLRNAVVRREDLAREAWVAELARLVGEEEDTAGQSAAASGVLEQMLPEVGEVSDLVRTSVERLMTRGGRVRITDLAIAAGVSVRQFRRRFTAAVDLPPKEFASAWRLRLCALRTLEPSPDWAALAAELGFADQAHLTREFRRWVGLTPHGLAQQTARIAHGAVRWPHAPGQVRSRVSEPVHKTEQR